MQKGRSTRILVYYTIMYVLYSTSSFNLKGSNAARMISESTYIIVIPIIKKGLEMYFIHVLLKALLSCWVIDFALLPCWAINPFWLDQ